MKNSIVILELLKRKRCKKENHNELGPELRLRRENLSLTLEEVAGEICSLSYLSKIENNQLIANQYYLEEICKKLNLDDEQINILLSTNKYMIIAVEAFIEHDDKKLQETYEAVLPFFNYKSKIVQFIYQINVGDYVEAIGLSKELNKIIGSMIEEDLVIYTSILACLRQKNGDYQEALDILDSLAGYNTNYLGLNYFNETTRFNCLFMLGDNHIFVSYNNLCHILSNTNEFYKLERFNYLINVYEIYSGSSYLYQNLYLTDESRKNIALLKKIADGIRPKVSEAKEATGMARLLALSIVDKKKCLMELDSYRGLDIILEFSIYIIEYRLLDEEEKYSYIENKIIPLLKANDVFYLRKYFLKELANLSRQNAKYKLFNLLYLEFLK